MNDISPWAPIFSSSGGSAHQNAAKYLSDENPAKGMSITNVMESRCVLGGFVGKRLIAQWDNAQKEGNVKKQVQLVKLQPLFEFFFFIPAYLTMLTILLSHGRKNLPDQVVATSPMLLPALCWAIRTVNFLFGNVGNRIEALDLYMVEPPTEGAIYYLRALRGLSVANKALVRLHGLPPTDPEFIKSLGLKAFIQEPVAKESYRASEKLPKPGDAATLTLKGQCDEEREFLRAHNDGVFEIQSEDRVGLVMLGGVPTASAIKDYIQAAINVTSQESSLEGENYLFIACGNPKDPKMVRLYKDVLAMIQDLPGSLTIIPFTGQPVDHIFARADLADTRSGGMTSQEIMCLKTNQDRNDPKRVLIHAQIGETVDPARYAHRALAIESITSRMPLSGLNLREAYQRALIRQGVPLWEGSNAQYLREQVGAEVVCPASAQEVMEEIFLGKARAPISFDAALFNVEHKAVKKAYEAALFKMKAQQYASIIISVVLLLSLAATSLFFTSLILLSPWILIGAIAAGIVALAVFIAMARFNPHRYVMQEILS